MSLCFTLCHSRGARASLPPIPEIALQIIQTHEGTLLSGVSMFINIWIIWSKQLIYTFISKHVREPFSKKYQCFEKYDKKNCFANYPNTWVRERFSQEFLCLQTFEQYDQNNCSANHANARGSTSIMNTDKHLNRKISLEMEEAPRYTLFTLFILFKLLALVKQYIYIQYMYYIYTWDRLPRCDQHAEAACAFLMSNYRYV